MSKTIKVELSKPIEGHRGLITELEFREPKWDEIIAHGEPYRVHQVDGGEPFFHTNMAALSAYAEACLIGPTTDSTLAFSMLGIEDTRSVLNAVGRFFLPEPAEDAGSTT